MGNLPLSGKLLNCRNAVPTIIAKNKVITDLIQALAVKIETDYTDDKNYKTLNYGKVILLTDADVDKFSQQQVAARFRDKQCNYLV